MTTHQKSTWRGNDNSFCISNYFNCVLSVTSQADELIQIWNHVISSAHTTESAIITFCPIIYTFLPSSLTRSHNMYRWRLIISSPKWDAVRANIWWNVNPMCESLRVMRRRAKAQCKCEMCPYDNKYCSIKSVHTQHRKQGDNPEKTFHFWEWMEERMQDSAESDYNC